MIKDTNMSPKDIQEMLGHLPQELKEKLINALKPDSCIDILKDFVARYEDDEPLDNIISFTLSSLLANIIIKVQEKMTKEGLSSYDIGLITADCLKEKAENTLKVLTKIRDLNE